MEREDAPSEWDTPPPSYEEACVSTFTGTSQPYPAAPYPVQQGVQPGYYPQPSYPVQQGVQPGYYHQPPYPVQQQGAQSGCYPQSPYPSCPAQPPYGVETQQPNPTHSPSAAHPLQNAQQNGFVELQVHSLQGVHTSPILPQPTAPSGVTDVQDVRLHPVNGHQSSGAAEGNFSGEAENQIDTADGAWICCDSCCDVDPNYKWYDCEGKGCFWIFPLALMWLVILVVLLGFGIVIMICYCVACCFMSDDD